MRNPIRKRARAILPELVGIAVVGVLMGTVVEALSPENLLRNHSGAVASTAGPGASGTGALSPPA